MRKTENNENHIEKTFFKLGVLLNCLNSLEHKKWHKPDDIADKISALDKEEIAVLLRMIRIIIEYTPPFELDRERGIKINYFSEKMRKSGINDLFVLMLFLKKAFDPDSALKGWNIGLGSAWVRADPFDKKYVLITDDCRFFLSKKGKAHAVGLLASNYRKLVDEFEEKTKNKGKKKNGRHGI